MSLLLTSSDDEHVLFDSVAFIFTFVVMEGKLTGTVIVSVLSYLGLFQSEIDVFDDLLSPQTGSKYFN